MDIWTSLFPILLTDIVNPVLFAFLVYAAGADRPVLLSSSMLLGHTTAYFGGGIVLSLFIERITSYLSEPHRVDFVIGLVIGLALLWVALKSRKNTGKRPEDDAPKLTVFSAFGLGAVINFIGLPFAIPYFAALDQILKADFSAAEAVVTLLAYNLVYVLPFALVPLLSAIMGERARPVLAKVNAVLDRISGFLMPILLGAVGLALVVDAIKYFTTGSGLF